MQAAVARGRTAHRTAAALRCAVDALPRNPAAAGSRLPAVRTRPPVPGLHRLRRVLRQRLIPPGPMRACANPTRSSMRERTRRPPALGCALASRIQAAMTVDHVTKLLLER